MGTISYSGYNGITNHQGMNFGHEDISIGGKVNHAFMMRAYAFQAGVARINYSWGVDPKRCAAAKAKKRKHAKAKAHLGNMVKALKKCHIGKKNAYELYKGSKHFEKKVKVWEKNTRSHHAKAKAHLGNMVKALKKCHIGKKNA